MPTQTFSQLAVAAFPFEYGTAAKMAAETLEPFVDAGYRQPSIEAHVLGRRVSIPSRIHFSDAPQLRDDHPSLAIQCLCTRSTDGYLRQQALRAIINSADPVAIPFITLLAGEYVVEIIEEIVVALPHLSHAPYANFVRENRLLVQKLRAKATSYWDCYYRQSFPKRSDYPGLVFLHEIEGWAG